MKNILNFASSLLLVFMFSFGIYAQDKGTPENVLEISQVMPSFPGGDLKLSEFLFQTVIYPDSARVLSTEGTVVVEFVVNEDGTIANPRIASKKMLGHGLEKEAIRVISKMPKWVPGSQDGKAVRVRYRLPLRFKLMN